MAFTWQIAGVITAVFLARGHTAAEDAERQAPASDVHGHFGPLSVLQGNQPLRSRAQPVNVTIKNDTRKADTLVSKKPVNVTIKNGTRKADTLVSKKPVNINIQNDTRKADTLVSKKPVNVKIKNDTHKAGSLVSKTHSTCPALVNVCATSDATSPSSCFKTCDELGCVAVSRMLSNTHEYQRVCSQCDCFKTCPRHISICGENHESPECLKTCQETSCAVVRKELPQRYEELCIGCPCYEQREPACPKIIQSPDCNASNFSSGCFKSCEQIGCDVVKAALPENFESLCGGCSCYEKPICGETIGICSNGSTEPGCVKSCQDVGCKTVKQNLPAQYDQLCSGCSCFATTCPKTIDICGDGRSSPECFMSCDQMGCDNVQRIYPAQFENLCSSCRCYQPSYEQACPSDITVCKADSSDCQKNCDEVGCNLVHLELPTKFEQLCSGCACYAHPVPVCPVAINTCANASQHGPGCLKSCDQVGCDTLAEHDPTRYEALCSQCRCYTGPICPALINTCSNASSAEGCMKTCDEVGCEAVQKYAHSEDYQRICSSCKCYNKTQALGIRIFQAQSKTPSLLRTSGRTFEKTQGSSKSKLLEPKHLEPRPLLRHIDATPIIDKLEHEVKQRNVQVHSTGEISIHEPQRSTSAAVTGKSDGKLDRDSVTAPKAVIFSVTAPKAVLSDPAEIVLDE